MPPATGIGHGTPARGVEISRRLRQVAWCRPPSPVPPPGRYGPVTEGRLSQMEAARLAGCSRDTIVRARRSGRFPNARLDNGRWMIPGRRPGRRRPLPAVRAGRRSSARRAVGPYRWGRRAHSVELARAEARIAGLEEVVARQDDELRFLRLTVETLAKRGAA